MTHSSKDRTSRSQKNRSRHVNHTSFCFLVLKSGTLFTDVHVGWLVRLIDHICFVHLDSHNCVMGASGVTVKFDKRKFLL